MASSSDKSPFPPRRTASASPPRRSSSAASHSPASPPSPAPRPTEGELAILQVLWRRGPCTVREVCAELAAARPTGYTTALKLLQIMFEKGLVRRDESERTHVYEAAMSEESTQKNIVGDLLDRVFGGSRETLLLRALSARRASPGEIDEIRRLLDVYEKKEGK